MLEECRLPYVVRPVDISKGKAIFGAVLGNLDPGARQDEPSRRTILFGQRAR